jgi:ribosomal protein L16/L10AE
VDKAKTSCNGLVTELGRWSSCSKSREIEAARVALKKCLDLAKGQQIKVTLDALATAQTKSARLLASCAAEQAGQVRDKVKAEVETTKKVGQSLAKALSGTTDALRNTRT